ncbi:hypothetical protein LCGC14_1282440, partial [marine sediment metagenome]
MSALPNRVKVILIDVSEDEVKMADGALVVGSAGNLTITGIVPIIQVLGSTAAVIS